MQALGLLHDFPVEVLLEVLKHLGARDVLRCRKVSYELHSLI
jgi:hypothetical protein